MLSWWEPGSWSLGLGSLQTPCGEEGRVGEGVVRRLAGPESPTCGLACLRRLPGILRLGCLGGGFTLFPRHHF